MLAAGGRGGRASFVGFLAFGLVVLALVSHDLRPVLEPGHDHGAKSVAGLCFEILGDVVPLLAGAVPSHRAGVVRVVPPSHLLAAAVPALGYVPARASPPWMQRFRN